MSLTVGAARTRRVAKAIAVDYGEKITVCVNVDVLGSELLHDRDSAIGRAVTSAADMVAEALSEVRVTRR